MVAFHHRSGKACLSEEPQLAPACSNYKDDLFVYVFQSLGKLNDCDQTHSKNIQSNLWSAPGKH